MYIISRVKVSLSEHWETLRIRLCSTDVCVLDNLCAFVYVVQMSVYSKPLRIRLCSTDVCVLETFAHSFM